MLTLLKAALIVTAAGCCGCSKRKDITTPARLQRDVLDGYDIQVQSLFAPLPSAYNQPRRNLDPYGSGLYPSRGHGQLNKYGRQYGRRPSPWGGQIQQNRNAGYRLYDESEETGGRFLGPQVSPTRNWRPISNYDGSVSPQIQPLPSMSPGQYRPQQQNSQWLQPIAPYYYFALPLKGSSIIQSTSRPSTIYQSNTPYVPLGYHVVFQETPGGPGYHKSHISFGEENNLTILQAEAPTQLDDISNDSSKPSNQFKCFNETVEPVLPRAPPTKSVDVAKDDTIASTPSQTADEIATSLPPTLPSTQSDVVTKDDGITINNGVKVGLKSEDVESIANESSLRKSPAPVPEDDIPTTTIKADLDSTGNGSIVLNSSLPQSATIAIHDPAAKSVENPDNDPALRSAVSEDASTSTQA